MVHFANGSMHPTAPPSFVVAHKLLSYTPTPVAYAPR